MKCICLIFILFQTEVIAQISPGPRSLSMGSAGVVLKDVWSLQHNSAGIAEIRSPIFAVGYERHFSDQDLSTQKAVLAIPFKQHVFGLSIHRYGLNEYSEQTAGIAYSRNFSGTLALSIVLKYHQLSIHKYGASRALSVDAGMQYRINDRLWIGTHISNPSNSRFQDLLGSTIPLSLSFGVSFEFSEKVLIISDIHKVLNATIDTKLGLEYSLIKWFALRGGMSASPFKQYAGFGLHYQRFALDVAISSHPNLGYSPNLAFSYEF
jgi:hypothetical protein